MEESWNFDGCYGGGLKSQTWNWNFWRGEKVTLKNPFVGRVWILAGKRHSACLVFLFTDLVWFCSSRCEIHWCSTFNIQVMSLVKIHPLLINCYGTWFPQILSCTQHQLWVYCGGVLRDVGRTLCIFKLCVIDFGSWPYRWEDAL